MSGPSVPLIALPIDLLSALVEDLEAQAPAGAVFCCVISEPFGRERIYKVFTGPGPAGPWSKFDEYFEEIEATSSHPLSPATSPRGGNDNQP